MKKRGLLRKGELLYVSAVVLYMLCMLVMLTIPGEIIQESALLLKCLKVVRYFTYAVVVFKLLLEYVKKKQVWYLTLVLFIAVMNAIASNDKVTIFFLLFVITARNISAEKIIFWTTFSQVLILGGTIFLFYVGVLPDYIFIEGDRVRHSFGFTWTTTPTILFFFITLGYFFLRKGKMLMVEYLILFAGNTFFFLQTKTRVTYALACMVIFFFYFFSNTNFLKKVFIKFKKCYAYIPLGVTSFSIWLHCSYDATNVKWIKLNSFLNNRLSLGYDAYQKYGVTLFGQPIKWIGNSYHGLQGTYNYVDCSYMQILLEQGVVFLLLVILIYTYLIWKSIKDENYYLCIVLLVIIVFSITEPRLFNVAFNPFPLCAGSFLGCKVLDRCMREENNGTH